MDQHSVSLTPVIVTFSAGLVSGWTTIYSQSESATAEKNFSEAEKHTARAALQLQLYLNLAHLMTTYPRQPKKLGQYMKQHLLEDHPAAPDEEEPAPEPPVED